MDLSNWSCIGNVRVYVFVYRKHIMCMDYVSP